MSSASLPFALAAWLPPAAEMAFVCAVVGALATAVLDLWQLVLSRFGVPGANFAFVGRWVGHMARGRFVHVSIARAEPVPGERALGWLVHYATGIVFAGLLVAWAGSGWLHRPTPGLALGFGLATVAAPLFLMQPAMGSGFAASRLPAPWRHRLRSVANHAVFGLGLYAAAVLVAGALPG